MKYAIITAILALGLAGCNLNGLSYDLSGLPSLNIDEVNCNNCNVNLNTEDADPIQLSDGRYHYYTVAKSSDFSVAKARENLESGDIVIDYAQEQIVKLRAKSWRPFSVSMDRGKRIVGSSGKNMRIEYGYGENTSLFWIQSSGNLSRFNGQWTDLPSGGHIYEGWFINRFDDDNITVQITSHAEVNFQEGVVDVWFENGLGESAYGFGRFENMLIGWAGSGEEDFTGSDGTHFLKGRFVGENAEGMEGFTWPVDTETTNVYGVFIAERSDTPVIAEN